MDLDYMLEEFYCLRGLDERGFPEAGVLEALGLEEAARALHGGERSAPDRGTVREGPPLYSTGSASFWESP